MPDKAYTITIDSRGELKAIKQATKDAEKFDTRLTKLGETSKRVLGGIARWSGVAGAALTGLFAKGIKDAAAFDQQMREVFTLLPNASAESLDKMRADVQALSRELGILPKEVVPALYQAISAGVPPDNVIDFLRTAGKTAIGGVADLQSAVDVLTSVTNAYGSEAISSQQASDLLFTTVKRGKTTMAELATTVGQVAPLAASLGVEFESVAAAISTITAKGVSTPQAVTQIRALLAELARGKGAQRFQELAGQSFQQFLAEGGSLIQALAMIDEHAEQSGGSLISMFESIEAGQAALNLLAGSKFAKDLAEMEAAAGATETAFGKMEEGIGRRFAKVQARVAALSIQVGSELIPAVESALNAFEGKADSPLLEAQLDLLKFRLLNIASTFGGAMIDAIRDAAGAAHRAVNPIARRAHEALTRERDRVQGVLASKVSQREQAQADFAADPLNAGAAIRANRLTEEINAMRAALAKANEQLGESTEYTKRGSEYRADEIAALKDYIESLTRTTQATEAATPSLAPAPAPSAARPAAPSVTPAQAATISQAALAQPAAASGSLSFTERFAAADAAVRANLGLVNVNPFASSTVATQPAGQFTAPGAATAGSAAAVSSQGFGNSGANAVQEAGSAAAQAIDEMRAEYIASFQEVSAAAISAFRDNIAEHAQLRNQIKDLKNS